jgi:hypothetical protein
LSLHPGTPWVEQAVHEAWDMALTHNKQHSLLVAVLCSLQKGSKDEVHAM